MVADICQQADNATPLADREDSNLPVNDAFRTNDIRVQLAGIGDHRTVRHEIATTEGERVVPKDSFTSETTEIV
jgi:hypothetical protein